MENLIACLPSYVEELKGSAAFMATLAVLVLAVGYFTRTRIPTIIFQLLRLLPWQSMASRWKKNDWDIRFRSRILGTLQVAWFLVVLYGAGALAATNERLADLVHNPVVIVCFNIVLVLLSGFVCVKLLQFLAEGNNRLRRWIMENMGTRITGIVIQESEVVSPKQVVRLLLRALGIFQFFVRILLILLFFFLLFTIVPQTRATAFALLQVVADVAQSGADSLMDYLPKLLSLTLIALGTLAALRLIRFFFNTVESGLLTFANFPAEWATPTYQVVRFVVFAMALVVAFPYLPGSGSPAFQGVSVFIGILLSLGSTSFISNIVAGVVLTYTNAFRINDRVKIGDTTGDVIEKSLLVTRIRTIKNVDIAIPNGMVLSAHILNYSSNASSHPLILTSTVTLGYDIPWRLVHKTLIDAAKNTQGVSGEPAPFVLQTALDDFYVRYEINAYTAQPSRMAVIYSELHQNIQDYCGRAGIEIMSPHYRAVRNGDESTISKEI